MVDVTLVWIPGHCDIHYNDIVDHCAKSATMDPDNIPSTFVTIDACKKLISKQCRALWQTRWQRANTGKATFDSMPRVGHELSFPRDRCSAISYIKLLLDDALLNVHQHKAGLKGNRNFHSRERKYHGMELSLPRAKVPRTFTPRNIRSRERKFLELSLPGTLAPWNFRSLELSHSFPGTIAP